MLTSTHKGQISITLKYAEGCWHRWKSTTGDSRRRQHDSSIKLFQQGLLEQEDDNAKLKVFFSLPTCHDASISSIPAIIVLDTPSEDMNYHSTEEVGLPPRF